jgi:WD40 repeat protein
MYVLGFSGDGKIVYLLVGKAGQEKGDRIAYWDIAARREIGSMATSGFETNYRLSPDGTLLAEGSWGSVRPLRIFDLAGRRELKPLKGRAAAFSADSRWLGVSHRDGTLRVWDTRTWKPVSPPLRVAEAASSGPLAFSPDGRLLLTGSGTGRVNVWDTASWTQRQTSFQAHTGNILNIVFSPDGKTVITNKVGPVAKFWNTKTWRQTLTLPCSNEFRTYFTPDGNTLVTSSDTTRIWRAASLAEADAPPRSSVAQGTDPPPPTRTPKSNATTTGIPKAP